LQVIENSKTVFFSKNCKTLQYVIFCFTRLILNDRSSQRAANAKHVFSRYFALGKTGCVLQKNCSHILII